MNKKLLMTGLLAMAIFPSCVTYTKTENEPPSKKKFQSGETARIFYEEIFVPKEVINDSNDQTLSLSIGLASPIRWQKRITGQKRVNDAFRSADLNQNGILTLREAQRFTESRKGDMK